MIGECKPRIALVHATSLAMEPVADALRRRWPEAEAVNILDDSLTRDRADGGCLTVQLTRRILNLTNYARSLGASGILFTCSAFGAAIEAANDAVTEPVLKPNEAMFEAALDAGKRIAMLYTFAPAAPGMIDEFSEVAICRGTDCEVVPVFVEGAIDAFRKADEATHNRLVAEAASKLSGFDAILLAHFSTSRALDAASSATTIPVFAAPDSAAMALRSRVTGRRLA